METEMVTTNGEWNIGFSTGEDALGNGDTEPVLEVSRRTFEDAENGWEEVWEHVGLFTADQVIDFLRHVEAVPFDRPKGWDKVEGVEVVGDGS